MLDEKTVQDLKEKHGAELVSVEGLVFRKPTRTEYDRWFDKMQVDKAQASKHARELASSCLVYPDQEAFKALIDRRPGLLATTIVNEITELAGLIGEEPIVKKL
jgi:hypothetical protein